MFLKQLLVGLGLCTGLASAIDFPQMPLTVNNAQYELRCGAASDAKHPCFTFLASDLKNVHVEITKDSASFDVIDLLVKDDQMRDFTIDDPSKSFSINWRDFGVSLIYSPEDTAEGTYNIQVQAPEDGRARIWVNDGLDGEGIDLDSDLRPDGNRVFASKWLRIHIANDRGQN